MTGPDSAAASMPSGHARSGQGCAEVVSLGTLKPTDATAGINRALTVRLARCGIGTWLQPHGVWSLRRSQGDSHRQNTHFTRSVSTLTTRR